MYRDDETPPRSTTRSLAPAAGLFVALLLGLGVLAIMQPSLHNGSSFMLPDEEPGAGRLASKLQSRAAGEGASSTSSVPVPPGEPPPSLPVPGAQFASSRVTERDAPALSAADEFTATQVGNVEDAPAPETSQPEPTMPAGVTNTPAVRATPTTAAVATPLPPTAVPDPEPDPDPTPEPTATPGLVDTLLDVLDLGH